MIQSLDFIGVPVQDLAATADFYRDVLGLTETKRAENFAEFDLAGATLTLNCVEAWGATFAPLPSGTLALHVSELQPATQRLRDAGIEVGEPYDTGVCLMAFFQDPAGNGLLLHHRYKPEH